MENTLKYIVISPWGCPGNGQLGDLESIEVKANTPEAAVREVTNWAGQLFVSQFNKKSKRVIDVRSTKRNTKNTPDICVMVVQLS